LVFVRIRHRPPQLNPTLSPAFTHRPETTPFMQLLPFDGSRPPITGNLAQLLLQEEETQVPQWVILNVVIMKVLRSAF